MTAAGSLRELGAGVVDAARRAGADEAEAYVSVSAGTTLQVAGGSVESVRVFRTVGVGLRVFVGARLGYAYTSDLSATGIRWLVEEAVDNARHNHPDPYNGLPDPEGPPPPMEWLDAPEFDSVPVTEKIRLAAAVEAAALAVPGITGVVSCTYGDERQEVAVVNSRGRSVSHAATLAYAFTEAVARRGEEAQAALGFVWARRPQDLRPEVAGLEAAHRAVRMLGARGMPAGRFPVILSAPVMARLLAQVARLLTGEAAQKGRSMFRDKLGHAVASPVVNVVDDPFHPQGLQSRPFDGEGVNSRRTPVIEGGRLVGYLHNTYTGRKAGLASTGNARRSSYRMTPEVGTSNLLLVPGQAAPDELIAAVGDGLLVTDLLGAHTISPVSGRFSVAVAGQRIEGGRLTHPVRDVAVSGEFSGLLQRITAVANDLHLQPDPQGVGAPSVLVEWLDVAGK